MCPLTLVEDLHKAIIAFALARRPASRRGSMRMRGTVAALEPWDAESELEGGQSCQDTSASTMRSTKLYTKGFKKGS